jgi:hypothetical protein
VRRREDEGFRGNRHRSYSTSPLSYRGEQSTRSVIDRRFSSARFDGSAPPAGRDFPIRKSAVICGGLYREPSVGGRTFELADMDGVVR